MASFTLTSLPPGAEVSVYERSAFPAVPASPSGSPVGTPVFSGTVPADGALVATGLKSGTSYLAYGDGRYVRFRTEATGVDIGVVQASHQTSNYVLGVGDPGKVIEIDSASARVVTVPADADVAIPVGGVVEICRLGAGTVTIAGAVGVTIRSPGSLLSIARQYSSVSLRKRASDEWVLIGDLA